MKKLLLVLAAAGAAATTASPVFAADVGVSVSVNQPGFYGRVDINQPPPPVALVYAQPVIIARPPVQVVQQPIYLHVPPGHEKKWSKHCHKYNACGQPVYFVRDTYYQQHYVVRQGDDHDGGEGHGHGHGKGKGKGHGKHD
ncbi:hypothetical protein [Ideonella sp. BN130291]|uniref:hypothetical protein n=1 Tax=Ideonella sp. BN130291 TaxID=3112940 RepID=UPI002E265666|nr:hypothetical protein [Ideonella sp. BN130291]